MAIKRSMKSETKQDFDDIMKEVNQEVEIQEAEDEIVERVPLLKTLSTNIDKATTTFINAALQLESAIQQYQRAEAKLNGSVDSVNRKIETINKHIDNVIEDAPTKLKISVSVCDADWQKIQSMFDQEHKWILGKMQEHIREVNGMFVNERKRMQERYKEYDGSYLGHYVQWFFWFFFTIGIFVVAGGIAILIAQHYGR